MDHLRLPKWIYDKLKNHPKTNIKTFYDIKVDKSLDELEKDPELARKFFNKLRKRKINKINGK